MLTFANLRIAFVSSSTQQLGSTTNVTICNAGFSGGEWSQKATFLTDTESL